MQKFIVNFVIFLVSLFSSFVAYSEDSVDDINWMTENYPPYNYSNSNGVAEGISVKAVEDLLKTVQSKKTVRNIEVMPWARAYNIVLNTKNSALFSTARTSERENKFKWVGPVASSRIVAFTKKAYNIKISKIDDLLKYKVGGVQNDVGEQLVLTALPSLKIQSTPKLEQGVMKLQVQNIDILVGDETVIKSIAQNLNLKLEEFDSVYVFENVQYWIAFNLNTDSSMVNKLQTAFDKSQSK